VTPKEYRLRKDDLIRREHAARNRAQLAAVAVDAARDRGEDALEVAMETYRAAQTSSKT
jgi:hypothetical protein